MIVVLQWRQFPWSHSAYSFCVDGKPPCNIGDTVLCLAFKHAPATSKCHCIFIFHTKHDFDYSIECKHINIIETNCYKQLLSKKKKKRKDFLCQKPAWPDQLSDGVLLSKALKFRVKGAFLKQLIVIPIVQVVLAGNAGLGPVTCDAIHQELKCNLNYSQSMLSGAGM